MGSRRGDDSFSSGPWPFNRMKLHPERTSESTALRDLLPAMDLARVARGPSVAKKLSKKSRSENILPSGMKRYSSKAAASTLAPYHGSPERSRRAIQERTRCNGRWERIWCATSAVNGMSKPFWRTALRRKRACDRSFCAHLNIFRRSLRACSALSPLFQQGRAAEYAERVESFSLGLASDSESTLGAYEEHLPRSG